LTTQTNRSSLVIAMGLELVCGPSLGGLAANAADVVTIKQQWIPQRTMELLVEFISFPFWIRVPG
jgi:hypothetical protein